MDKLIAFAAAALFAGLAFAVTELSKPEPLTRPAVTALRQEPTIRIAPERLVVAAELLEHHGAAREQTVIN